MHQATCLANWDSQDHAHILEAFSNELTLPVFFQLLCQIWFLLRLFLNFILVLNLIFLSIQSLPLHHNSLLLLYSIPIQMIVSDQPSLSLHLDVTKNNQSSNLPKKELL